jgi:hypothetical protein
MSVCLLESIWGFEMPHVTILPLFYLCCAEAVLSLLADFVIEAVGICISLVSWILSPDGGVMLTERQDNPLILTTKVAHQTIISTSSNETTSHLDIINGPWRCMSTGIKQACQHRRHSHDCRIITLSPVIIASCRSGGGPAMSGSRLRPDWRRIDASLSVVTSSGSIR